ncbi:cupredoxin family copper-binding protein [Streptomyces zaomyceticus]|uniref:cupredoxin domain-containing protein n=1 Tax=Streptomyces zaomyceticus TaxID=68286 RepID=UPI0036C201B8
MTVVVALLATLIGALIVAVLAYDIVRLISTGESRCPPLARLRGRRASLAATERWCTGLRLHDRISAGEYRSRMSGIARGRRRLRGRAPLRVDKPARTAESAALAQVAGARLAMTHSAAPISPVIPMTYLPRTPRAALATTGALCLALLVAGCGDDGGGTSSPATSAPSAPGTPSAPATPPPSPTASAEVRITIRGFAFQPTDLKVRPGATVTVVNEDSAPHTVTATGSDAFDTGEIAGGRSATFTAPDKPGTYPFFCSIHPNMKATLTVS